MGKIIKNDMVNILELPVVVRNNATDEQWRELIDKAKKRKIFKNSGITQSGHAFLDTLKGQRFIYTKRSTR